MFDTTSLRNVIGKAITTCIAGIKFDGIDGSTMTTFNVSSNHLRDALWQLITQGQAELVVPAAIQVLIRISNSDTLRSDQEMPFRVILTDREHGVAAIAVNEECWKSAWERAMDPIKGTALESMKNDVRRLGPKLADDSYGFQAALVMVASKMIGPYPDRIADFLGYPESLVQGIGTRLYEACIWCEDKVCCETWLDPARGYIAALCHVMVAQGSLKMSWSEEGQELRYCLADTTDIIKVTL